MKTAMILAAGRGERLKPLTDSTPKAMCTVKNIPLIEHHVIHLAQAGFDRIVVNHAWLGSKIRHHLGNGARWGVEICYAPEPPGGLETAGGIVNALPLLGKTPFMTVNADIYTDYNFSTPTLLDNPNTKATLGLAHLVLINKPAYFTNGDFGISGLNLLDNNNRQYTFAGIAYYRPELFSKLNIGRYSITPILRQLALKQQAYASIHTGQWIDIGSPQRLAQANTL